ncbi:MAG TPA: CoA pyrophosphatase [Ktedonobacteraceae bacterium]|nr:CoA pyrophosphatase [Ktedonobacteraceae bacterium]
MHVQDNMDVIALLRKRLEPVECADELSDTLEGQHPHARKAAVMLGLLNQQGEICVVFIRRSSRLRSHGGEIAFPGGAFEWRDSSLIMTAIREAQEEIGLDPSRVEVLGVLEPVFTVVSNYLALPVVAFLPDGLGKVELQSSEVSEIIIVPLRILADPSIYHSEEWTRQGQTRTIHFYDYGFYRIWGATARMLRAFLALLEQGS